jgi:hypothetical protein
MTINERLAVVETQVTDIRCDTRSLVNALQDNGRPGLITRLDRVEQKIAAQCFWLRTLGTGLALALIKAALDIWVRWEQVIDKVNDITR